MHIQWRCLQPHSHICQLHICSHFCHLDEGFVVSLCVFAAELLTLYTGCVLAGQGLVPEPPHQAEEGHHQGFRQTFLLHQWIAGHVQHPAPPGAGATPIWSRPATKLPAGATAAPNAQRFPAEQPRRGLVHLPRHQQQHPAQLLARRDFRVVSAVPGRNSAFAEARSPTTALPLLFHATARRRPPWTDLRVWLRFLSLWAVHAAGQEGGGSGRKEDGFLSDGVFFRDFRGLCKSILWHLSRQARKNRSKIGCFGCSTILFPQHCGPHADTKWF